MDMKKNTLYLPILLLLAASCEGFLNESPQSDLTRSYTATSELKSAYASVAEAEAELNGAYALFKADIYEADIFFVGDVMSGNCYIGGDGVPEEQFEKMALTATNSQIALMWSQYYAALGSATNVIENVRIMDDSDISAQDRDRISAEAKFIRAWILFDIVRLWGGAPMPLELIPSITTENLDRWYPVMYPARTPEEDIYAQILSDLDEVVIENLESRSSGAFRASRGAAWGLKALVLATMGEKSGRDYSEVVRLCDCVISEGYSLVDDFDFLWTLPGKFSSESIFELYFSDAAEQHNWAYWIFLTDISGEVSVSWRRYCTPTHDLIAKFDRENDVRYRSSIFWTRVPYDTYYPAGNYPLAYKIRRKESDIILLRLADVMLLKAEALVELGNAGDAIAIVNEIRTRAKVSTLDENMDVASARLAVENERQLELLLEGKRWFDLIRNGRMEEVMHQARDRNGNLRFSNIPAWRRKLPIPQGQIDINERLTQNEGY